MNKIQASPVPPKPPLFTGAEKMRKMYCEPGELDTQNTVCLQSDEPCGDHDELVYVFTVAELEALKREYFEAGVRRAEIVELDDAFVSEIFEQYEQTKK